jgi:dihydrofolate reductase
MNAMMKTISDKSTRDELIERIKRLNENATAKWGDPAEGIRELKAEPGKPIVAISGAGFMQSLMATGLIDEYHLYIHPVISGSGLPIFTGIAQPLYLKLVDVKTFPGGVIALTYMG